MRKHWEYLTGLMYMKYGVAISVQ